jgi:hypothetical protein
MQIIEDGYGGNNDPIDGTKITKSMVEDWVGSDNLDPDSFLDLLTALINGEYTIENFKKDVTEYSDEYFDRTGKNYD